MHENGQAPHFLASPMRAPRGAGSNSSARLYAPAPAAWPFQRLARRALARPGRKRLDDVVAGAGSAAPLPVAPPAPQRTDRGFPGGIKAERRMPEQIFHESGRAGTGHGRKRAGGCMAWLARRKDGRELKAAPAAQRRIASGCWVRALPASACAAFGKRPLELDTL